MLAGLHRAAHPSTSMELAGELGYIKRGSKPKIGVDLKAASESDMAMFECGGANETTGKGAGTGTLRELQGSVIGKAGKLDAMVKETRPPTQSTAASRSPKHSKAASRTR
jgi:hypothetical protein